MQIKLHASTHMYVNLARNSIKQIDATGIQLEKSILLVLIYIYVCVCLQHTFVYVNHVGEQKHQ